MFDLGPAVLLFNRFENNTVIGFTDNFIFGAWAASDIYLLVFIFMDLDYHMTGSGGEFLV